MLGRETYSLIKGRDFTTSSWSLGKMATWLPTSWQLEQTLGQVESWTTRGLGLPSPLRPKNPCINFGSPKTTTVFPWYLRRFGSQTPLLPPLYVPKSEDVRVLYVKWHRTVPSRSPPHPPIPNCRAKILLFICGWLNLQMRNPRIRRGNSIFIEKNVMCKWTHAV